MHAKHRASAFLLILAAMLFSAVSGRAQSDPEGAADWRPTLDVYTKMADESNARLNEQRELLQRAVDRFRKEFALIENLRQQVALFEITAEDPWDYRDVLRGIRQLRARINAISKGPAAIKERAEAALARLRQIEADILAQKTNADISEEFAKGLEVFRGKLDVLRANATELDRQLSEALSPATLMIDALNREEDSIKAKTGEIWESFYSTRHPAIFEMSPQDNILMQWDAWKTGIGYILETLHRLNAADDRPGKLVGGLGTALIAMAAFMAVIAWIRKKGLFRTRPAGLYRTAMLFSASLGLG